MRNVIIILTVLLLFCSNDIHSQNNTITSCLVSNTCHPDSVVPIGDPFLDYECSIAINRLLARTMGAGHLSWLLHPGHPLDTVNNFYRNEEKYCKMIKSMVDLDIQFVERASFGSFFFEHEFYEGHPYFNTVAQIVKDINYAYDCANKRRPVIGGMAFEVINDSNFLNTVDSIPAWLINEYFKYYREDLQDTSIFNYYFSVNTNGDTIVKKNIFDKDRIIGNVGPRINNVEWRMFYLYQAFVQINMGYKAIHLGIYWADIMAGTEFEKLAKLADVMREYAKSKNTFVLISGENPMPANDRGNSAKVPGKDRFIFDFESRAIRPREVSTQTINGDGGCTDPIPQYILDDLSNSPCSDFLLNAVIDPCVIKMFGGDTIHGFSAHDTSCRLEQIPYIAHFDGFYNPEDCLLQPSSAEEWNDWSTLTWGFDDHNWFAMLPEDCKTWWYDYFYCDRRLYHNSSGFVTIPGIINNTWDTTNCGGPRINSQQLIFEQSELLQHIKDHTLQVVKPVANFYTYLKIYDRKCKCNGIAPPRKIYNRYTSCYRIYLEDTSKDCSSVYSVHIQNPDGSWQPQKLNSTTYDFCPTKTGTYKVFIRQDYLGSLVRYGETEIHHLNLISGCELIDGNCPGIPGVGDNISGTIEDYYPLDGQNENWNDFNQFFSVLPNPTTGNLSVNIKSFNPNSEVAINIFNSIGEIIYKSNNIISEENVTININFLENVKPGLYYIKIDNNHNSFLSKIVKI